MRLLRRLVYALSYMLFLFTKELTTATFQVARLALSRRLTFRPGFVSIPLDARSDFEITSFANSITLTPGTISVHVSDDQQRLVIHAIDVGDDLEELRRSIKESLEAPILRFTR